MQKLIQRMGTEQQSFRLTLTFCRLTLPNDSLNSACRIVLQRNSKQYSSNFISTRGNKATPLNQSISVKMTLFYDKQQKHYQQKNFDLMIVRRDGKKQETVAKWTFASQSFVEKGSHAELVLKDQLNNELQAYVTVERLDCRNGNDSVERVQDIKAIRYRPIEQVPDRISQKTEYSSNSNQKEVQLIKFDDEDQKQEAKTPLTVIQSPQQSISIKSHKNIFDQNNQTQRIPSFRNAPIGQKIQVRKQQRSKPKDRTTHPISHQQISPFSKTIKKPFNQHDQPLKKSLGELQRKISQSMLQRSRIVEQVQQEQNDIVTNLRVANNQLKTLNGRLQAEWNDVKRELEEVRNQYADLLKRNERTLGQLRDLKFQKNRLQSANAELETKLQLLQNQKNQSQLKYLDSQHTILKNHVESLQRELKNLQEHSYNQQAQIYKLISTKQQFVNKQAELIKKYQKINQELSTHRKSHQEYRAVAIQKIQQLDRLLKEKDEQARMQRNHIAHLEFLMIKPDRHMDDREKDLLKQRLERLLKDLEQQAAENLSIQEALKNSIKNKEAEICILMSKIDSIQSHLLQAENVWHSKEKSLCKALEAKDKKIVELSKELEKQQQRLCETSQFIEKEKRQIVSQMACLNDQLQRLKNVDAQLASFQISSRETELKLKQATCQNTQLRVELTQVQSQLARYKQDLVKSNSHIDDLEGELVRQNVRNAEIIQRVFERDPHLAQELTKLKV